MLSISAYNDAEEQAKVELPNEVLRALSPAFFERIGYPTRIHSEQQLFNYIDVMHELRFERDFETLMGGLSRSEFELFKCVTSLVCKFSEHSFSRKAIARSSILRSLHVLRQIRFVWGEQRPAVLEVGPGCGYLGAMLILEGYPYAATDVTQAFYLYQNRFWNFVTDGGVVECADPGSLVEPESGRPIHIPWWVFAELDGPMMSSFQVVTCNHAVGEMHPNSLRHMLRLARTSHGGAGDPAAFVIDGFYWTPLNSMEDLMEDFYHFGYALAHHDPKIALFAPSNTPSAEGALSLPRVPSKKWNRRLRNILRRIMGRQVSTERQEQWGLKEKDYVSAKNKISQAIVSGRKALVSEEWVSIDEVEDFHTKLLGTTDHYSPGEKFLQELQY